MQTKSEAFTSHMEKFFPGYYILGAFLTLGFYINWMATMGVDKSVVVVGAGVLAVSWPFAILGHFSIWLFSLFF